MSGFLGAIFGALAVFVILWLIGRKMPFVGGKFLLYERKIYDWWTGWDKDELSYQDKQKAGAVSRPEIPKRLSYIKRMRIAAREKRIQKGR